VPCIIWIYFSKFRMASIEIFGNYFCHPKTITWCALCRWLATLAPAITRCHHHHLLPRLRLLSSWQLLLRASGCSMKLSKLWHNRTRVVAMPAKAEKRINIAISRTFRTPSRRFSRKPLNLWKPMNGSRLLSRSSAC
jgi:hypothetical protein